MPTFADVNFAMQRVQHTWGAHIPGGLLGYTANQITVFPDEAGYTRAFRFIYDVVFKAANNFHQQAEDFIDGVLAFVSPTFDHAKRKIYVAPKVQGYTQAQQRMVLSHEYIHWLSHEKFYPTYYMVGGQHPFQIEGLTHWMTVACGYQLEAMTLPAYVDETTKADAWLRADGGNRQRLLDFLFRGIPTDLSEIHP
jgi:hypothetical protein